VVAADQASKAAVIANIQPYSVHQILGPILSFTNVSNNSAAFSLGFGVTWIFTLLSALAALALLWFGPRMRTLGWALLAGTALGGIVGNLIDRLTRAPGFPNGMVVDFIQIPFNFPIFNIADSAICVTAFIVVIRVARGQKLGG